jgi:hypothetical protein
VGGEVIRAPPCIFPYRFSIENIQGRVKMTSEPGLAPPVTASPLITEAAVCACDARLIPTPPGNVISWTQEIFSVGIYSIARVGSSATGLSREGLLPADLGAVLMVARAAPSG